MSANVFLNWLESSQGKKTGKCLDVIIERAGFKRFDGESDQHLADRIMMKSEEDFKIRVRNKLYTGLLG